MSKARLLFLLFAFICNPACAVKSETQFSGESSSGHYSDGLFGKDMVALDLKKYGFVFYYNSIQWELKASAPTKFDFKFRQGNISTNIFVSWAVFPLEYMPESDLANFKKFVSSTAKIVKSDLGESNGVKIITTEFEMDFQNKPITCISIYSVSAIGAVKLQSFIETASVDEDAIKKSREQIVLFGRGLVGANN